MRGRLDPILDLARGALGGLTATAAMSGVMLVAERAGLMGRHPPERIMERGMDAAGAPRSRTGVDVAAGATHFAFGAGCGALFGLVAGRLGGLPLGRRLPEALGVPFALVVWLVSYFGWIPALRIMPPPPEDRPGRAWTMLAAHLVYGVALGGAWRLLRR